MTFHQRKFASLSTPQQHKKAAECLRLAYEGDCEAFKHYLDMCDWLELELLPFDQKLLSDRYHIHLKEARQQLKEPNLLSPIRQKDRTESLAPPLNISIYLDHLRSAHNVGSILRTIEAFQLGTLFLSEGCPDLSHKQVRDTSMGTHAWVTCQTGISLAQLPRPLILLETSPSATALAEFSFPMNFTLVVGNEEYGCSQEALQAADALVEIPLFGRKNSLNVANAFAIAAAQINQQLRSS